MRIAIIEDVLTEAEKLRGFIRQYCGENGLSAEVDLYHSSAEFLDKFHRQYDVLFFDIELSHNEADGMQAAHIVRSQDEDCTIVFVTNLAKYAIEGYQVNAQDFILKPINYEGFKFRFDAVTRRFANLDSGEHSILVKSKGSYYKLKVKDIYYICIINHICYFYGTFSEGDDASHLTCYETWMQLNTAQKEIDSDKFVKCSPSYLINIDKVNKIEKNAVVVGATSLPLSRNKKKDVVLAYMRGFGK